MPEPLSTNFARGGGVAAKQRPSEREWGESEDEEGLGQGRSGAGGKNNEKISRDVPWKSKARWPMPRGRPTNTVALSLRQKVPLTRRAK